ncbi:hypothetical protein HG531_004551 [Fusarium graminearum]|nr:hypothetical protein HG531_004551 [Fusarium graminearum]
MAEAHGDGKLPHKIERLGGKETFLLHISNNLCLRFRIIQITDNTTIIGDILRQKRRIFLLVTLYGMKPGRRSRTMFLLFNDLLNVCAQKQRAYQLDKSNGSISEKHHAVTRDLFQTRIFQGVDDPTGEEVACGGAKHA